MKRHSLFLLIFMVMLPACTAQSMATPSPTLVIKNTPPTTTTPKPTQTVEPTPIPITVADISLGSCTRIVEAKISDAGVFEVVFENDDKSSSASIISEFGSPDGKLGVNLVLWSAGTQKTTVFPLPSDALGPKISPDHRWILFRRDTGETQSEFWVTDIDGKAEKKLGAVVLDDEMKASYPDGLFSLNYGWIPNTEKFFYDVEVTYGTIPPLIIDKFVLVDANSEKAIPLTIQSEIKIFRFSPDGSQMTILMDGELRVVSTENGRTLFTIQAPFNDPTYSPDGKFIIDFIDEGILRINALDGEHQVIQLKYTIMSARTEGPSYGPLPDFKWTGNSTFIFASLNSDERYVFPLFKSDPNWTFTVWNVDLASGSTHPIQTFNGNPFEASFSPDLNRLAFWRYEGILPSQTRNLILADLATGEILETIEGGVFEIWFPDSTQYLYETDYPYPPSGKGDPGASDIVIRHYLGQVGKEPMLVDWGASGFGSSERWWVDQNRLIVDCKIVTFR